MFRRVVIVLNVAFALAILILFAISMSSGFTLLPFIFALVLAGLLILNALLVWQGAEIEVPGLRLFRIWQYWLRVTEVELRAKAERLGLVGGANE